MLENQAGTWTPISGSGGGGGTPGSPSLSFQYNNGGVFGGITPATTNGLYYPVENVTANVATAPQLFQVGMGGRAITGASSSDTVAYSDNGSVIDHDIGCSAAVTETLPTATTLLNPAFVFAYANHCNQTDTISPSTWTIQSGITAAASTLSVAAGTFCRIKVDPNLSTNWLADCTEIAGAGTVTSIATTSPLGGGTITTTGTLSCPTCVTSASSLTNTEPVCGAGSQASASCNLSGDITTSGSAATTLATVNTNVGSFTSANITVNAKGLVTAAANGSAAGCTASCTWYPFWVAAPGNITVDSNGVNQVILSRFTKATTDKVTKASVFISTGVAASTGDVGMYGNCSTTCTLIWKAGGFATATSATAVTTTITPVTVGPGTYYLARCDTSASVAFSVGTFSGNTQNLANGGGVNFAYDGTDLCSAGVLPTTITVANFTIYAGFNGVVAVAASN